nr:hypothetical protein [Tanacetum cinerariifolium]
MVSHLKMINTFSQHKSNKSSNLKIWLDDHPTGSLNDLDFVTLHIDAQSMDVDAPPDTIDVDEDDDIIDDEDALPYDLADSDDEDLVNVDDDDDDDVAVVYSNVSRCSKGHGGDGGGDDNLLPHQIGGGYRGNPKTQLGRQESRHAEYPQRNQEPQMETSATRDYPSLIHTFFLTHTVGSVFLNPEDKALYDEMLRLQGLGSNTPTGVPYTEEDIMAIVRGGKQRGHIPARVAGAGMMSQEMMRTAMRMRRRRTIVRGCGFPGRHVSRENPPPWHLIVCLKLCGPDIVAREGILFELFRSMFPGRHVALETYPLRQVARDSPELSLGKMANVVVLLGIRERNVQASSHLITYPYFKNLHTITRDRASRGAGRASRASHAKGASKLNSHRSGMKNLYSYKVVNGMYIYPGKEQEEMLRLQGLGTYIDDLIMAIVRRGEQRHIPGIGRVLTGRGRDVLIGSGGGRDDEPDDDEDADKEEEEEDADS